jgi:hypothetical protein
MRRLATAVLWRIAMGRRSVLNPVRSLANKVIAYFKSPSFEKGMLRIAFICLAAAMLFDPGRDTLQISSAAFVTTLALASVTFSYARSLKEGSAIRDELIFAGEKLVIAAVVFLFASILKHASNDIPKYMNISIELLKTPKEQLLDMTLFGHHIIEIMISMIAFIVFLVGLLNAQIGIFIVTNIASHRMIRRPGHEDDVIDAASFRKRLAELDKMEGGETGSPSHNSHESAPVS